MIRPSWLLTPLLTLPLAGLAADEEDLALAYGDAATVTIATGSKQSLRRAPAVASVFTAEDIRAMGANDLGQVLEQVPGLHVGKTYYLYDPRYYLRGIGGEFSPQLLFLVDGIRRQAPTLGGPEEAWVNMPVEQIARVEVIRGPGSALYGADAFAGVIAVTTWRGAERPGLRTKVMVGSRDTHAITLSHGGHEGALQWYGHLRVGQTDGPNERIEADVQTTLDGLFGTRASLAPGSLHRPHDDLDTQLTVGLGSWELLGSYKARRRIGTGAGLASALSGRDRVDVRLGVLGLSYQKTEWAPGWDVQAQIDLNRMSGDTAFWLFPAGAFGGAFPDGMFGSPGRSTRVTHAEAAATFRGLEGHRVRFGAGAQRVNVYETHEIKNFRFMVIPGIGPAAIPLGQMVDTSTSDPYMRPQKRRLSYLLLQDEWRVQPDWTLTLGVRHDRYSDFGATTNPRAAVVWDARHDLTLKLLVGKAFRAPTFAELYTENNPVQQGNPSLQPERIQTWEVAADWQASPAFSLGINLFRYKVRDQIRLVPNADPTTGSTVQNLGDQEGRGMETEVRWQASARIKLTGSFSVQSSTDKLLNTKPGMTPGRMLKLGMDSRLSADWHLAAQAWHVAGRVRDPGDLRSPVPNYALLDLTVHWRRASPTAWQVTGTLRNLFNTDAREPSPAPGSIPGDFPLQKRQVELQVSKTW
ncbi:TonB-dependent receptor plug domain-containing protein [Inhella gelatinilytica]|uniref:TonB-dependent receptor n=1 Tax=Inhella gelatinilytica TaxID=2795030 RepID=A0A931NAS9_9BURK|nr:TonB-dependent receptor [Inhella gelatinilytica]MBH9552813.1 TonB-dependent receptor [Inhella gelatinilytica]